MASVAIIGGGISGLTAAYFLKRFNIQFTLFEASGHLGGKIKSERNSGYLIEHGPNSLQTATPLLNQIIDETGLGQHQVFAADDAKKRFVVRRGEPVALPTSPPALLASNLFSLKGKLGLLREPFVSRPEGNPEESVAAFVKRRLGKEVLDYAVDPFVSGIFAGNPDALSVKHAFPKLHALEKEFGSLLKGSLSGRKRKKDDASATKTVKRRIFSFEEGLEMLPAAISKPLLDDIRLECRVTNIIPAKTGWHLQTETASYQEIHAFDAVISTLPLPALLHAGLEVAQDLTPLWQVHYPPVTVFALGFHKADVEHPLDGFGMLVPGREQGFQMLGTIFSSTVFPNRAPRDHVLLTTLIGGARKGDLCNLSDELLLDFVLDDLHRLLGVHADPVFFKKIAWDHAIPQYSLGYGRVKELLATLEACHRGLFFAGNYRSGIAVGEAMESGYNAAQRVIESIG